MTMELVWVRACLENAEYINQLREQIGHVLPDMSYKPERNPHITVLPGLGFRDTDSIYGVNHLQYAAGHSPLIGHSFRVTGLEWFPSRERPMVLMLTVDLDLESERGRLTDIIDRYDSEHIHTPVAAHITLYNARDGENWENVSNETIRETEDIINMFAGRDVWTETISDVVVETWGDDPQ